MPRNPQFEGQPGYDVFGEPVADWATTHTPQETYAMGASENAVKNLYGIVTNPNQSLNDYFSSLAGGGGGGAGGTRQSNLLTPMSREELAAQQEDIYNRMRSEQEARRLEAESTFGPKIERTEKLGKAQISSVQGAEGQSGGFNLSTARLSFLNNVQGQIEDKIREIQKEKESYIASGNIESQKRADDAIDKLRTYNLDLIYKKADLVLQENTQALQEKQFEFTQKQTGLENLRADKLLDFQLDAEDRTITAETRAAAAKEKDAVLNLMATYSVAKIDKNDSIDVALQKASPYLEESRKLELEKLKSEIGSIRRSNAGGGGETTLSADEQDYLGLLTKNAETGEYEVDPNLIETFVAGKGVDRLTAANRALNLANRINNSATLQKGVDTFFENYKSMSSPSAFDYLKSGAGNFFSLLFGG